MIPLIVALSLVVGVSLGLLGGGGSILTVPLLAYVAGLAPGNAIATSLLVVGVTAVFAAIAHARAGRVHWRAAAVVGVVAMIGAYAGGSVARFVPGSVLLVAFAVVMIGAGLAMLRGRGDCDAVEARPLPLARMVLLGVAVGLLSGLLGAGGGFLLVPALALLGGLSMPAAIGTSLVVIAMQSFAGFAGHLAAVHVDWRLAGMATAAAVLGALLGGRLVAYLDPATLRSLFGWFVLSMASLVITEEVGVAAGGATAGVTLIAAAASFICTHYARCPLRRLTRRTAAGSAA